MAPGWCRRKGLRLYQIIRNVTGDLGIPLVAIQPLVLELKKTRLMHLPDLFEGRRKKGKCDLVCVCVKCLWMIGLMVVMLISFSRVVSMVLILWRVSPGMGVEFADKNHVGLFQGSEMSAG